MRKSLAIAGLLFVLFPTSAVAKCRFACVAHKVTDLKTLTLGLEDQLEEAEGRIARQATSIEALKTRAAQLETWDSQTSSWAKTFESCFGEVPISRYGEEQGPSGYLFQLEGDGFFSTLPTTALDISYPHDPVGAWIYVNACNKERVTAKASLLSSNP